MPYDVHWKMPVYGDIFTDKSSLDVTAPLSSAKLSTRGFLKTLFNKIAFTSAQMYDPVLVGSEKLIS